MRPLSLAVHVLAITLWRVAGRNGTPGLWGDGTPVLSTERELLLKRDPGSPCAPGSRGMARMGGGAAGMSCRTPWSHPLHLPLEPEQGEGAGDAPVVLLLLADAH